MRFISRPVGLTFLLTVFVLAAIAAVLACAPRAPDRQGDKAKPTVKPTPAPTATPELIYVHIKGTLTPIEAPPTPVPNAAVPAGIIMQAERYIATREAQQTQGIRSADPQPTHEVVIYLSTDDHIEAVAQMLEAGGSFIYSTEIATEHYRTHVHAEVPLSLFLAMEADDRIKHVEQNLPPWHLSAPNAPSSQTPSTTIQKWHDFGFKGQQVQVGIIDDGFRGFATIVQPTLNTPLTVLCFPTRPPNAPPGTPTTPKDILSDCEGSTDHGITIASDILRVAPNAVLYLARVNNGDQFKQAVDWMTVKRQTKDQHQAAVAAANTAVASHDAPEQLDTNSAPVFSVPARPARWSI